MGKFDKAMGVMDDEMLDEVNGGFTPDVTGLDDQQILDMYNTLAETHMRHLEKNWNTLLPAMFADEIDALQYLERVMNEKQIPYVSVLTA